MRKRNDEYPKASGVVLGEAAASEREKLVHHSGTPDPVSQAHVLADRRAMGHNKCGHAPK